MNCEIYVFSTQYKSTLKSNQLDQKYHRCWSYTTRQQGLIPQHFIDAHLDSYVPQKKDIVDILVNRLLYLPSCQHMSTEAQPRVITDAIHNHIHGWEWLPRLDEEFKVHRGARTNGIYGSNACIVNVIWYEIADVDTGRVPRARLEDTQRRGVQLRVHLEFKVRDFGSTVVLWDVPCDVDAGARLIRLPRRDRRRRDT